MPDTPQPLNAAQQQNRAGWNAMADGWSGTTLPAWGCLAPTEDELHLLGDLAGKAVLEIGCGSGQSLLYCARHGAAQLWGLDLSNNQIAGAKRLFAQQGAGLPAPHLLQSPMESDPGLPHGHFDVVYSVYAIGWSTNLPATLGLVAQYLKPGGHFVFSWDHPMLHCLSVEAENGRYVLDEGFFDRAPFTFDKGGGPLTLTNRRFSDYIAALAAAGLVLEQLVEETGGIAKPPAPFCYFFGARKSKVWPES